MKAEDARDDEAMACMHSLVSEMELKLREKEVTHTGGQPLQSLDTP